MEGILQGMHVYTLSSVGLSVTLWTVAHQALCPWTFSGKNTGVAAFPPPGTLPHSGTGLTSHDSFIGRQILCHVPPGKSESERSSVVSDSMQLNSPWNSPGQNPGVGSLPLLQRILPTQGLNPGLLHCRRILYQLSHNRSPTHRRTV